MLLHSTFLFLPTRLTQTNFIVEVCPSSVLGPSLDVAVEEVEFLTMDSEWGFPLQRQ